jgi:DNA-binding response OmpR family regulator
LNNVPSSVDLPRAIESAVENAVGLTEFDSVAVIAEYPAHFPQTTGTQDEAIALISSMITQMGMLTTGGDVRVRSELLAAGALPELNLILSGNPESLIDSGPTALLSVSMHGEDGAADAVDQLLSVLRESEAPNEPFSVSKAVQFLGEFGGLFWADVDEAGGIRLAFALPLQAAQAVDADTSSLQHALDSTFNNVNQETKKLLIVVEDETIQETVSRDLIAAGYSVIVVSDGSNVLSLARTEKPDLILLDLDARKPMAFDIALILKQDRAARNIPVLFITTVDGPDGGLRMGAMSFLVRPSGTGRLVAAIRAVLGSGLHPSTRVMVVESDAPTREILIMMIQSEGYRVTEARGPEEALALAERLNPGLMLVNAQLAHERDYWLLRRLRQLSQDTSIYILADELTDEEGQQAIIRGASGYGQTGQLRELLDDVRSRQTGQL